MKLFKGRWIRVILLTGFVFSLVAVPSSVAADIAPPAQPPGSNPQPGVETTQVRMTSETVILQVLPDAPQGSLGQARVSANFIMHNLGTQTEKMAVRFPTGVEYGRGDNPHITDMVVKVDGVTAVLRDTTGEDPYYGSGSVPWIEFDAAFPPDKDVIIKVSYTLEAGGEYPFDIFSYVFSTGAGWKGTIGSATLFVRFPYAVSELNVLPSNRADEPNLVVDHKISSNELKWTWTDLEPERGDNFEIWTVQPSVWQKVLDAEEQVKKTSYDGEAWGMLGKLYKLLAFDTRRKGFRSGNYVTDAGAQELYHKSVSAYENAVRLKALDPLWHAGFADLLAYYAYHAGFEGIDTMPEKLQALQEMQKALVLAPKDEKVLEIADELTFYIEGGVVGQGYTYAFPWLTATPEPTATLIGWDIGTPATETATMQDPTHTALPPTATATPSPQPTPTPAKPVTLCGSLLFAPFVLGMLLIKRKKR